MSEPKIRRTRNGARLPADQATPRYLGENIEKDLREVLDPLGLAWSRPDDLSTWPNQR